MISFDNDLNDLHFKTQAVVKDDVTGQEKKRDCIHKIRAYHRLYNRERSK